MAQSPMLLFESIAFTDAPSDDEQTNPGIFGKSLAQWLAQQLPSHGFTAGEVIPEDFGWCVPLQPSPHALYVACSSAESNNWQVFVFSEGSFISRLLGKDKGHESVASAFAAIKNLLLASPQVKALHEVAA